ncbi:Aspartic peptidase [Parasponia andersonii]|uniref:Aspartic peptidase n=1 Tax=Parasponia andersonii TaxID=3476 RepID=A0A2P5C859_PARAD|nr:Aspartic peptidase [Parasponia andersonii]
MPTLSFHLEGGDLKVKLENAYDFGEARNYKYFCLAMMRSNDVTIIGAFQQMNQRFRFDTRGAELSFGPEVLTTLHSTQLHLPRKNSKPRSPNQMRRRYLFSDAKPESIRQKTNVQRDAIFLVEVGIGTFRNATPPYIPYLLVFDTGSDLTWTQCEDCRKPGNQCFNQTQPIFPNTRSASFRPLPCTEPLRLCLPATQCRGGTCTSLHNYNDNSSARGILGCESFGFGSTSAADRVELVRLVFGCVIDRRGIRFGTTQPNSIAGVMGSALGPLSMISQLRQQTDDHFSYCIPQTRNDGCVPRSLLRFGADIPQRRGTLRSTALLRLHGDVNPYYLNLLDMSIGGGRLRIPRNHFALNGILKGSIIDSGSGLSMIIVLDIGDF